MRLFFDRITRASLILLALSSLLAIPSLGNAAGRRVYVRGYINSHGTYVMPHYKTAPDGNFWNNWSTYPNVNPYTGEVGRKTFPGYRSYYSRNYSNPYSQYATPTRRKQEYGTSYLRNQSSPYYTRTRSIYDTQSDEDDELSEDTDEQDQ